MQENLFSSPSCSWVVSFDICSLSTSHPIVTSGLSGSDDFNLWKGHILGGSDLAFFPNRISIFFALDSYETFIKIVNNHFLGECKYKKHVNYLSQQTNKKKIYPFIKNYGQCSFINSDLTIELNLIIWSHIYL